MLVIQRTETGRLQLTDRRRTGTADGEAEARRTLYHWGYTDLSINKALAEMRRAEGTLPSVAPWRVVRPTDATPEKVVEAASTPTDDPQSAEPQDRGVPAKRSRRRTGRAAAAEEQPASPNGSAPAPESSPAEPQSESTPPEPRTRKPGSARKRKQPAAAIAETPVDVAPAAEDPAEPAADSRRTGARTAKPKPSSERKQAAPAEPQPEVAAPEADPPAPAKRARRGGRTRSAETPAPVAQAERSDTERTSAAMVREAEPIHGGEPAVPQIPATSKEEQEPTAPARKRRARSRTPASALAPDPAAPSVDADPVADALAIFAEGARALKQMEAQALPFARGPWTQLREQAEHIVACLQGKEPRTS